MPTIEFFSGGAIIDYDPEQGLKTPKRPYRLMTHFDGSPMSELLDAFEQEENLGELQSLLIGYWGTDILDDSAEPELVRDRLIALAPKLTSLRSIFWGDISYEESEISWIENCDVGPLLAAFPELTYFKGRGGNGLRLTGLKHANLKKLRIETGGLDGDTLQDVIQAELPALEELELWLGSSDYGFSSSAEDFKPLIIGRAYPELVYPFPKLSYLGLRNSEIADDLAELFADAKVLQQLKTLDFSMGTMTDRGVEALINLPSLGKVKKIVLSNNCIEDEELIEKLRARGVKVEANDQKSPDDAYVDVGE